MSTTTTSTMQAPLSDKQVTTPEKEYSGVLQIEKGVLKFTGASVLVNSIIQVSNYPVRLANRISLIQMVICAIFGVLFLGIASIDIPFGMPSLGFFAIPGLLLLAATGYGIYERTRPERYGLTVELTSGFRHYFIDKNRDFINSIYYEFVDALQNKRDFYKVFNNSSNIIHAGTNATVNVAQGGANVDNSTGKTEIKNTGGDVNIGSHNTDNSISIGDGNKTGDIGHNNNIGNTSLSGGSQANNIGNNIS